MMLRQRRASERSGTNDGFEAFAFALAVKKPTPEETLAENELRATVNRANCYSTKKPASGNPSS